MEAFYYANQTTRGYDSASTPGFHLVGEVELPPGNYVVFAKADLGVNVDSGYPPPAWPYASGMLALTLDGKNDEAYIGVKPESSENNESVALMIAAKTSTTRHARLYFISVYPLRVYVNSVRMIAVQVDGLSVVEVGSDDTALPEEISTFARLFAEAGTRFRLSDFLKKG